MHKCCHSTVYFTLLTDLAIRWSKKKSFKTVNSHFDFYICVDLSFGNRQTCVVSLFMSLCISCISFFFCKRARFELVLDHSLRLFIRISQVLLQDMKDFIFYWHKKNIIIMINMRQTHKNLFWYHITIWLYNYYYVACKRVFIWI